MNTLKAIEKYIKPEELKSILRGNVLIRGNVDGITGLFSPPPKESGINRTIWDAIYSALWDTIRRKHGRLNVFIYIEEWKPIKDWLLQEDIDMKNTREIYNMLCNAYPYTNNRDGFESIKTYDVLSSLYIMNRLLIHHNLIGHQLEFKFTTDFYKTHNRFPNDFEL